MSRVAVKYNNVTPPPPGYIIKHSDQKIQASEIAAAKMCKKFIAYGVDQQGGQDSLVLVRGRGIPISSHEDYKKADLIPNQVARAQALSVFLEPLLDSAVNMVAEWAQEYGWLHK